MDNDPPALAQKKKRAYAAQPAYEFGGNVPFQQAQAPPPMMGPGAMAAPAMGGQPMAAQPMGVQPMLGQPMGAQPMLGQQMGTQQMGMASPPGLIPQDDPLASQFGHMNLQSQPQQPVSQMQQQQAQQMQQSRQTPMAQNQLYPSDLISQPFRVEELDNPPPAINLPPNVSYSSESVAQVLMYTDERYSVTLCQLRPQVRSLHS
jgi:protein transport protein SEC24